MASTFSSVPSDRIFLFKILSPCIVSVHPGRVARHVIKTWYASCVVGESYRIHACVRAEDILYESAECANRIKLSALHVIILLTLEPL
jgi:hypothetical protein